MYRLAVNRFLAPSACARGAGIRAFSSTSFLLGKVVPFKLADIGEGIQEVQVLEVKVKPGDSLKEFDNICAVQSDKATVDITSRYTGVVKKVYLVAGETAKVGEPIIDIEVEDGAPTDAAPAAAAPAAAPAAAAPAAAAAAAPSSGAGVIPFKLADIGEGIQEVQVLEVYVKKGDHVEEMEKVCTVQSDKATVDITSRYSGTIADVHVESGKTFKVGDVLIDIVAEGQAAPAVPAAPAATSMTAASSAATASSCARSAAQMGRKALSTPATRYLAKQHNVDLNLVPATGKGGRVTKEDLHHYMSGATRSAAPTAAATTGVSQAAPVGAAAAAAAATARPSVVGEYAGVKAYTGDEVVPIAGVRRGMVKTMTAAASVPMFGFTEEFEMSNLMALRKSMKDSVKSRSRGTVSLSFMPFFIKSCSLALSQFPDINSHCPPDCSVLIRKKEHNIGFAMDTPNGLIVPVVKDVANKSLYDLAVDLQLLITKGKENKLSADDFAGGTFSISNVGAIGGLAPSPTVLPPQVAIAALGSTRVVPRFDESGDNLIKANVMTVGFSADHRVIDGATMVRFSNAWKRYVENPGTMLMDVK